MHFLGVATGERARLETIAGARYLGIRASALPPRLRAAVTRLAARPKECPLGNAHSRGLPSSVRGGRVHDGAKRRGVLLFLRLFETRNPRLRSSLYCASAQRALRPSGPATRFAR